MADRFNQYVQPEPNTGCYLWTGQLNNMGRPRFHAVHRSTVRKEVRVLASRWIGQAKYGPLPDDWHIHHNCGNVLCVNPDHLIPMYGPEHQSHHSKGDGFCPRGHEYAVHGYFRQHGPRKGWVAYCRPCRNAARRVTPCN